MTLAVGVLGLGTMGSGISARLVGAGFATSGWDPVPERLAAFVATGGRAANGPQGVAAGTDVVVLSLPTEASYETVIADLAGIGRAGQIVVDTSTMPLALKLRCRDLLAAKGVTLLDCPVSGAGKQAAAGILAMEMSGPREACEAVRPLLDAFCADATWVGEFGAGTRIKLIINLMVHVSNILTAESMLLAEKAGIDPDVFIDIVGKSVVGSRIFRTRAEVMKRREYDDPALRTAALAIALKDNKLIRAYAEGLGAPTPMLDAIMPFYDAATARGWADRDAGVLYEVVRAMVGAGRD